MTRLRKHLEAARHEYEAAKYPGDLAAELLRPLRRNWPWAPWLAAAAAAAVVMLATSVYGPKPTRQIVTPIQPDPDVEQQFVEIAPAFSPSEMGSEEALTLPVSDFGFSMPTITLIDDEPSESTSTTQEAIS